MEPLDFPPQTPLKVGAAVDDFGFRKTSRIADIANSFKVDIDLISVPFRD